MPNTLDTQRQLIRAQLARSRRRLDRKTRQLVSNTPRWLPLNRLRSSDSSHARPIAVTATMALVGWALSRWGFGTESFMQWRNQQLGHAVSNWLDRLVRHVRVAAWQYRRAARSHPSEVTDD